MSLSMLIISIIIIDICMLLYDYYYARLNYEPYKITKLKFLIYLIVSILIIIIDLSNIFILKQISHFIQYILPLIYYKNTTTNKLYNLFSLILIICLLDQIVSIISTGIITILQVNLIQTTNFTESSFFYIGLTLILLVMFLFIVRSNLLINLLNRLRMNLKKNKLMLFNYLLLIVFLYTLISYDLFHAVDSTTKLIILIICTYLIVSTVILTIYYSMIKKHNEYTNNLIINMKGFNDIVTEYRKEKHNLNNFLLSLKDNKDTKLNKRIDEYLNQNNKIKLNNNNIFDIPYEISGFIISKMNQYKCKYYMNNIENLKDLKLDNPRLYNELCNAIGICIDNAYDAIKNQKKKEIIINVEKSNNKTIIEFYNRFNNNIDINQLGKLFYTTKSNGNGIGLFSINKFKYIKCNIMIFNNIFKIQLKI